MFEPRVKPIFENRHDAGRQLAETLLDYRGRVDVVLAIPNGGVAVAVEVALALKADLDLVITRKIPMPLNPEAGFGAVVDDGTIIVDDAMVKRIGLTPEQIEHSVNRVRAEIRHRSLLYHKDRPLTSVVAKTVIIVDDGLASGLTMTAAVDSVRHRHAREVVAAAPVASGSGFDRVRRTGARVVTCFTAQTGSFAVASYYRHWYDVGDDEVLRILDDFRRRRARAD